MVTESLLYLASLVGLPHWLLGTVVMLNNPLVSKILDKVMDLAIEDFFSRLWRVVRPLLSRGGASFKAWFKGPRASASSTTAPTSMTTSTTTTSTTTTTTTSINTTTSAVSSNAMGAARAAGTTTPPPGFCGRNAGPVALVALPSRSGVRVVAGLMR